MPLTLAEALAKAQTIPARFDALNRALDLLLQMFNFILRVSGILLGVFLVHQLFFWLSKNPENAFSYAALFIDVLEIVWDLTSILYNAVADIFNSALAPIWNAFTFYVVEPSVTLVLEVFSLIFLRKQYTGLISDDALPYGGFVCDPNSQPSSLWCGRFNAYNERLNNGDSLTAEGSVTFGTATARRLSEISGEADFDVPSVSSGDLVGALDGLSTQGIVMGGSAFDVLFAVLYEVFSTSAVFIFDALYTIFKVLFEVFKLVIKSGLLQTLIGIGIDFILIMVLEIYVPLLISMVDAVVCVFQLFMVSSWKEQLECGKQEYRTQGPRARPVLFLCVCCLPVRSRLEVLPRPRRRGGLLDVQFRASSDGALRVDFGGHHELEDRQEVHGRANDFIRSRRPQERLPLVDGLGMYAVFHLQVSGAARHLVCHRNLRVAALTRQV